MYKNIAMAMIFTANLLGCSSIQNPSASVQPVMRQANNQLFTTCSGMVEDWGSCSAKAKNSCPNGYDVVKKEESPVGGKRELTFVCR